MICARHTMSLRRLVSMTRRARRFFFFFFNDTATTEIYTLSLHDALPISHLQGFATDAQREGDVCEGILRRCLQIFLQDRKSTRLNSSHSQISYAVFCLKKKKPQHITRGCLLPSAPSSPYRQSPRARWQAP